MKTWWMLAAAAVAMAALMGCAKELELTSGGEGVQLMQALPAGVDCKETSTHTVSAQATVQMKGSSMEREEKDRITTARNAASKMGANVIVPEGELDGKSRNYKAYNCAL